MKKMLMAAGAAAAMLAAMPASAATVVIDPATGGSGSFGWVNGLGPIDEIDGVSDLDAATFGITAAAGGTIDVTLIDCCIPGDEFALFLNGLQLTASSVSSPGGNFNYFFDDVLLASGSNIFSINLTALAPDFIDGGADYQFSAVTPGTTAPVPEPGTWAMMLVGFGAIGFTMRRRRLALPARA